MEQPLKATLSRRTFLAGSAVAAAAAGLTLAGCGAAGQEKEYARTAPDGRPKIQVITTIFPPYDFVRQIGGDYVEADMLLKPGMEAHSYEPTPRDIIRMNGE